MIAPSDEHESDVQAALARYAQSLHKYTQELWLEARRKAELEAKARTRTMKAEAGRAAATAPPPSRRTLHAA